MDKKIQEEEAEEINRISLECKEKLAEIKDEQEKILSDFILEIEKDKIDELRDKLD